MSGKHFPCAGLSAPCGQGCWRETETWQITGLLKQRLMRFPTEGKPKRKRRLQQAGRCLHHPPFGVWLVSGACFCEHSIQVGSRIHGCLTVAHLAAEVAGRISIGGLHYQIFRESCISRSLFISSPDLYPIRFAKGQIQIGDVPRAYLITL